MMKQWNTRALFRLLAPLLLEQVLGVTIGLADMIMVGVVGESAVSGVSLVDAVTMLITTLFSALAAGGSVVVSQYLGRGEKKNADNAAAQLVSINILFSLVITALALLFHRNLLRLIYGSIDADVREAGETYFWISALSYPFLALYHAGAALFRSAGNTRVTMLAALMVNALNIGGNGLLIMGLGLGVTGAAVSTLVSRAAGALTLAALLRAARHGGISLAGPPGFRFPFEPSMVRRILSISIPGGLENGMFQIGKIMVSRIFTSFGTGAIAANAVAGVVSSFAYMPGNAFSLGILTVISRCLGARDYEAARHLTGALVKMAYAVLWAVHALIFLCMNPLLGLFSLSPEALALARSFLLVHGIASPAAWPLSFALPSALRAAGDARYCMIVAVISMWTVRVSASYFMAYTLGFGPVSVWYAMAGDFAVRSVWYTRRWFKGGWETKRVI
jgi:putative MATE family efflux protein